MYLSTESEIDYSTHSIIIENKTTFIDVGCHRGKNNEAKERNLSKRGKRGEKRMGNVSQVLLNLFSYAYFVSDPRFGAGAWVR